MGGVTRSWWAWLDDSRRVVMEMGDDPELDEQAAPEDKAPDETTRLKPAASGCEPPPKGPHPNLSKWSAAILLMTWSTSSSNVMYPWTFGVLGVILGPILMLLVFGVSLRSTLWIVAAARHHESKTLGDLGESMYGKPGRYILEGSQIGFQQIFLAVAISYGTGAVRSLLKDDAGYFDCNIRVIWVFVGLGLVLIQFSQRLHEQITFAYISVFLIGVQTICLIWSFTASTPIDGEPRGGWELAYGQDWDDHDDRYKWYNLFGALSTFVYSCLPACIVVETMSTMENPEDMEFAVYCSFALYSLVYIATGVVGCIGWGGDVVNPCTDVMHNNWGGVLTKWILVYSTMLDFVIASTTVNSYLVRMMGITYGWTYSCEDMGRWFLISLPSALMAFIMACVTPKLETLTGLSDSLTGTTVQISGMAGLMLVGNGGDHGVSRTTLILTLGFGILLSVLIFSETFYTVGWRTHYTAGNYWCDVVGG